MSGRRFLSDHDVASVTALKASEVAVLSGAPYDYLYIRKGDDLVVSFEIITDEAEIVCLMLKKYTVGVD